MLSLVIRSSRVLVVDDDPSPRDGLLRLLNAAGYDARGFESAEEMLRTIDRESGFIGCIILDSRLRGFSGVDLHRELMARGLTAPVIVLTADAGPGPTRMARDLEAAGFFCKPVDGPALLDAIEWALSKTA